LREHWRISEAQPALLYVGRLSREKGLDMLGPLSRRLDAARISHRLVLVGDGPMRAELEQTLPGAIFTGTLRPDDVATAMASCDVFVFPSQTDTAGNVILEAQASGLPVLVSHAGGPRENMRPGQSGFVCRNPGDFAAHTADPLRNPDLRWRFRVSARAYASTRRWETALEPLYARTWLRCLPKIPVQLRPSRPLSPEPRFTSPACC
jgi:glycosyltransferase involved in cell wall biosynthesis